MEELTIEEMTALRGGDKGGIPHNKTDDALVDLQNEAILLQINNAFGVTKLNIHIK
jgi:hypothetical protein